MKKLTAFIFFLVAALSASAQSVYEKPSEAELPQRRALFEKKNKDIPARYMHGGVPEVDGKVTWTRTYELEGQSSEQIYNKALSYFSNLVKSENHTNKSAIAGVNRVDHKIIVRCQEWLVFSSKALSLDRTKFNYAVSVDCSDGRCKVIVTNLSYNYEEDRPTAVHYTAEEMISDKVAFNKKGTGFTKGGTKKFRIGTIDRMDQILSDLNIALK